MAEWRWSPCQSRGRWRPTRHSATIVAKGEARARPELAHSVHVEVAGLQPDRPYFYRFTAGGERSAARPCAHPSANQRGALASCASGCAGCQDYQAGYYTAYRHLAPRGPRLRIPLRRLHLRIWPRQPRRPPAFEPADHVARRLSPPLRPVQSRPDLQSAHAAHPFFMTFDDHEVRNNWAGDIDDDDQTPPPRSFACTGKSAFQAWYEHMPVRRRQLPNGSGAPALSQRALRQSRRGSTSSIPGSSAPTSRAAMATGWPARR